MAQMMKVFWYELRRNFRRKGYLFTTFGFPIIGLLIMTLIQSVGGQAMSSSGSGSGSLLSGMTFSGLSASKIGYVDKAGIFAETRDGLSFKPYADETQAHEALDAGDISVYYVISEAYLETGDVQLVMPKLNITQLSSAPIRNALLQVLARDLEDNAVLDRLSNPSNLEVVYVNPVSNSDGGEGQMLIVTYVFMFLLIMAVFMTNGYLLQILIEEKETRVIEILLLSATPLQLLVGKILALGLLGLFQIVFWIGFVVFNVTTSDAGAALGTMASMMGGITIPPMIIPLFLVYFVLVYLLFAAAYSIVGALSNSAKEGSQYASMFVLPVIVPMWFTNAFISDPNGGLPTFLSLFPITTPLAMLQRLMLSAVPPWQIGLSLALLAVLVVVLMWLAARVFRAQTLLAGQKFRLADIPRLLRA